MSQLRTEAGTVRSAEVRSSFPGVVVHAEPSDMARRVNRLARLFVKPALRWGPLADPVMRKIQAFERESRPSSRVDSRRILLGGVAGERIRPAGGAVRDLTILYIHGGGFFAGSVDSYRRLLERFALKSGGTVYGIDYRQLPDHPLAVSVDDAITAYEAVREIVGPGAPVVVAGDSAGGYLTMKVAELAQRRGIEAPAALIGYSPLLSVDPLGERKSHVLHVPVHDAYLPPKRVAQIRERWLPEGVHVEGFTDPFHAVGRIDVPTQLVAVEDEMLRPETEAFAMRLSERGVPVEYHLWRGMVHAFPFLVGLVPESAQAIDLAVDFVERVLDTRTDEDSQA